MIVFNWKKVCFCIEKNDILKTWEGVVHSCDWSQPSRSSSSLSLSLFHVKPYWRRRRYLRFRFVSMALTLEVVAETLLEQTPSATVFTPIRLSRNQVSRSLTSSAALPGSLT